MVFQLGQFAVNFGDVKVVRQGVKTKKPGSWEVYDLVRDPGETKDLAAERPELIRKAPEILKAQTLPNPVFPMPEPDSK